MVQIKNKKAVELTMQTIVVFILMLVVLIVMIYFFTNHYGANSDSIIDIGNGAIEQAKNFS